MKSDGKHKEMEWEDMWTVARFSSKLEPWHVVCREKKALPKRKTLPLAEP